MKAMVEGRDYFFYNQDAESYLMQFGHKWNTEGIKNNVPVEFINFYL